MPKHTKKVAGGNGRKRKPKKKQVAGGNGKKRQRPSSVFT